MKSEFKKVRDLISGYLCNGSESKLPMLDVSEETLGNSRFYRKYYYTGVTIDYIHKTLLKNKFNKSLVIYTLFDMLDNEEIKSLFCEDIGNVVFENKYNNHWSYGVEKNTETLNEGGSIVEILPEEFEIYKKIQKQYEKTMCCIR